MTLNIAPQLVADHRAALGRDAGRSRLRRLVSRAAASDAFVAPATPAVIVAARPGLVDRPGLVEKVA